MSRRTFLGWAPFAVTLPSIAFAGEKTGNEANPTVLPGAFLNARDFGAKGNGRVDDTAALQDVIATARKTRTGIVYLPGGWTCPIISSVFGGVIKLNR